METVKDIYKYNDFSKFDINISNVLSNLNSYNSRYNAFCRVYEDDVLNYSNVIKEKMKLQSCGKLAGMIIGLKDLFCYKDHIVQASSKILENFVPNYNSSVVDFILGEDGLIVGHQNCDEFGMGASTVNSVYGPSHNFIDYSRTAGGSSGGSAVAIQANMCHVSLGTDTGGSIRQPASYCGIIGFKPSYGMISRFGVIEHSSSFDTVGILGRYVDDILDVFSVISKHDDSDLSMCNFEDIESVKSKDKYNICVFSNVIGLDYIDVAVRNGINSFLDYLKTYNDLEYVDFDKIEYCSSVYFTLTTIEACTNLSRYNGLNYGYRAKNYSTFDEMVVNTREEGFGFEVKKRLLFGNYLLETNDINKYIDKSNFLREYYRNEFRKIFDKYDFIIMPITVSGAFKLDECRDELLSTWDDNFATLASITGYPAISIPCGYDSNNVPFCVQIISKIYNDYNLLDFVKNLKFSVKNNK